MDKMDDLPHHVRFFHMPTDEASRERNVYLYQLCYRFAFFQSLCFVIYVMSLILIGTSSPWVSAFVIVFQVVSIAIGITLTLRERDMGQGKNLFATTQLGMFVCVRPKRVEDSWVATHIPLPSLNPMKTLFDTLLAVRGTGNNAVTAIRAAMEKM